MAGWLYDRFGRYDVAFWLCAVAFMAATAGIFLIPQPMPPRR